MLQLPNEHERELFVCLLALKEGAATAKLLGKRIGTKASPWFIGRMLGDLAHRGEVWIQERPKRSPENPERSRVYEITHAGASRITTILSD